MRRSTAKPVISIHRCDNVFWSLRRNCVSSIMLEAWVLKFNAARNNFVCASNVRVQVWKFSGFSTKKGKQRRPSVAYKEKHRRECWLAIDFIAPSRNQSGSITSEKITKFSTLNWAPSKWAHLVISAIVGVSYCLLSQLFAVSVRSKVSERWATKTVRFNILNIDTTKISTDFQRIHSEFKGLFSLEFD